MKKLFSKILSIIMVFIVAATCLCGCNKQPVNNDDEVVNKPAITENYIVNANSSDYKIVTSQNPTAFEEYASTELQKYINQATGVSLKIVTDNEITVSNKLISIGYNAIQQEKVTVDKKALGDDGFIIKTVDDDLFLVGGASTGTLYSVYEVLEYLINFKVYASDEIILSKTQTISLFDFDITEVPSFESRHLNTATFNAAGDVFDAAKLRLLCYDHSSGQSGMQMTDEGVVNGVWGCWAHTIGAKLLPWSKYYNDHPDWFEGIETNDGYQVMMTNPEVIDEIAKNLKKIMDNNTTAKYFMVGINDNGKTHSGDQAVADANGGWGGVYMLFLNAIADKIAAWYEEEGVERDYLIVGLAYMKYVDAPIDDNFNPVNKDVIAHDKVAIMYAPIQVDWSEAITDKNSQRNKQYADAMKGWANITPNMMVWSYSISFGEYLLDFDNYSTFKDNYQFYKDLGVVYILDQAAGQTAIPFNALRDYVQATLMWDVTANPGELIEDFIDNYYKVAAPYIKEFFYRIRSNYQMFLDKGIIDIMHCGNSPTNREMFMKGWTLDFCQDSMKNINDAINAVKQSSLSNEMKETLIKRIELDSIMPRYIMLSKFADDFVSSDYRVLLEKFEYDVDMLGITCMNETYGSRSIDDFIKSCWGKIS